MTTDDSSGYRPIACDRHSQYELMAMHKTWVRLDAEGSDGPIQGLRCRVLDVVTRDRAEYLKVVTAAGEVRDYRLDSLIAVEPEGV